MKVLLFDPSAGASGDMIMGCLLDLGADPDQVREAVESVGCRLEISRVEKRNIAATKATVVADGRFHSVAEARSILKASSLEPQALDNALKILETLASAEAGVHGTGSKEVHFHEIGALDALADIAGSSAALQSLNPDRVFSLPISVGGGTVFSVHGLLPVPAPATLEILRLSGLLWKGGPVDVELLTPTGAAILANVVDEAVDRYPKIRAEEVGYGSGIRDLEIPNLLRSVLGTREGARHGHHHNRVVQLETNLDDVTGEVLGNLVELLMSEGALDVSVVSALMKKGRLGSIVKVIAEEGQMDRLSALIMRETGSLGIRVFPSLHRYVAPRESRDVTLEIEGKRYEVSVKVSWIEGSVLNLKAEYEDCRRIAKETGLPLKEVARRIEEKGWNVVG